MPQPKSFKPTFGRWHLNLAKQRCPAKQPPEVNRMHEQLHWRSTSCLCRVHATAHATWTHLHTHQHAFLFACLLTWRHVGAVTKLAPASLFTVTPSTSGAWAPLKSGVSHVENGVSTLAKPEGCCYEYSLHEIQFMAILICAYTMRCIHVNLRQACRACREGQEGHLARRALATGRKINQNNS